MTRNAPHLIHPNAPLYPLNAEKAAEVIADSQANPTAFLLEEAGAVARHGTPYARLLAELGQVVGSMDRAHYMAFGAGSMVAHRLARLASTHQQPLPHLTERGYLDLHDFSARHIEGFVDRAMNLLNGLRTSEDGVDIIPPDPSEIADLTPGHYLLQGFKSFLDAEPDMVNAMGSWRTERLDPPRQAFDIGAAVALGGLHVAAQLPRGTV
jgi:hypothetical protein